MSPFEKATKARRQVEATVSRILEHTSVKHCSTHNGCLQSMTLRLEGAVSYETLTTLHTALGSAAIRVDCGGRLCDDGGEFRIRPHLEIEMLFPEGWVPP